MSRPNHDARPFPRAAALRPTLLILAFALAALAFLVAIDRGHWFRLRPASGTAAAMAHAADDAGGPGSRR